MKGSSHVATIFGIPVKIHWSFGLLFLWVAYVSSKEGFNLTLFISRLILFLSVFVCVILHEFGHALVARRFGVKTFDIIMTPIGGIARLERMPEGRGQEFWVAIAGPFVNFVIAFLIWLGFFLSTGQVWPDMSVQSWTYRDHASEYFYLLMAANLGLGIFNLLPAFPMDGGRILRSLLSLRMDRGRATRIASYAGQAIALMMFGWGVYTSQPILTLIGVFIFFAARQENQILQKQTLLASVKAFDLMEPIEHIFFTGQSLSDAGAIAKSLKDDSYIVWSRFGIPAGYIMKEKLVNESASANSSSVIDPFILPAPIVVGPETSIGQLFAFMQHNKIPISLVADNTNYLGVIPWRKIADLIRK